MAELPISIHLVVANSLQYGLTCDLYCPYASNLLQGFAIKLVTFAVDFVRWQWSSAPLQLNFSVLHSNLSYLHFNLLPLQ